MCSPKSRYVGSHGWTQDPATLGSASGSPHACATLPETANMLCAPHLPCAPFWAHGEPSIYRVRPMVKDLPWAFRTLSCVFGTQQTALCLVVQARLRQANKKKKKIWLTLSNYQKSPIFNLQLQNKVTKAIQLLKPNKFGPLDGFEGGFSFCED